MSTSIPYAELTNYDKDRIDELFKFYITHKFLKISPRVGGPYMYKRNTPHQLLVSKIGYSKYAI